MFPYIIFVQGVREAKILTHYLTVWQKKGSIYTPYQNIERKSHLTLCGRLFILIFILIFIIFSIFLLLYCEVYDDGDKHKIHVSRSMKNENVGFPSARFHSNFLSIFSHILAPNSDDCRAVILRWPYWIFYINCYTNLCFE